MTGSRASQKRTRREGRLRGVTGWEYVHVMVDDHSRLAYAEVLDGLTSSCAVAFLRRAVAWFAERGVHVCEVMSDNGSCYVAHEYAHALSELQLRHLRIKPGRPRTNGKAERSSRRFSTNGHTDGSTAVGGTHRSATALPRALQLQTTSGSLGKQVPASRLNNLVGNYT